MDKALEQKLEEVHDRLRQLRLAIKRTTAHAERQDEECDDLRKERWSLVKRVNTLNRVAEEYDEMAEHNERLGAERDELFQRLQKVLNFTKLLSTHYRS